MLYTRRNYILMAVSILLIIVGFIMMSGGGSSDPNVFNEEIFSVRRIVWAPIVCVSGFLLMIYAILAKAQTPEANQTK